MFERLNLSGGSQAKIEKFGIFFLWFSSLFLKDGGSSCSKVWAFLKYLTPVCSVRKILGKDL